MNKNKCNFHIVHVQDSRGLGWNQDFVLESKKKIQKPPQKKVVQKIISIVSRKLQ